MNNSEKQSEPKAETGVWRQRSWKRYALIAVALGLLAAAGWWGWKLWRAPLAELEKYQFATVQRGDIEDLVTATGTMQPRDYVDVGAQVSGQLKKIHVEVGSVVEAGDLLGEIDPTVFRANVDARRALIKNQTAAVTDRESQLALAELQFTRQKNLLAGDATTKEAYQAAEASLRSAKAQLAASRASLEQTESTLRADEANLNYAKIYAPIAGVVVSITARQGQTLNANQQAPTILRIADLSTMTVQTQVSEADVTRLRSGMEVYFTTLGNRNRRWYGNLRKVEPTPIVTNNVVLFNALFDVANTQRNLLPQMTAQVFFIAAEARDVLYVPAGAVVSNRRGSNEGGGRRGTSAKDKMPEAETQSAARNESQQKQAASRSHAAAEADASNADTPRLERGDMAIKSAKAAGLEHATAQKVERNERRPSETGRGELPRPAGVPDLSNMLPEERRAALEKLTPEQREAMREWRRASREQRGSERVEGESNPGPTSKAMQPPAAQVTPPRDSTRAHNDEGRPSKTQSAFSNMPETAKAGGDKPVDKLPAAMVWTGVGDQSSRGAREATVKVVKADNTIEERKIQVGISNRIYVQVISGLAEGDKVISGLKPPPGATRAQQGQQRNALQGTQQGPSGMTPGGMGAGGQGARAR